jgi:hypothetical protein
VVSDYDLRSYVPIPLAREAPRWEVKNRGDVEVTVVWKNAEGKALSTRDIPFFYEDVDYQAEITLTAQEGYAFHPDKPFAYEEDLVTAQTSNTNKNYLSRTVTVTYKPTQRLETVPSLDLTAYLARPLTNGTPSSSFSGPYYSGTVKWNSPTGPFAGIFQINTVYTAEVTLTAFAGYTFSGVPENGFTHSDGAVTNPAGTEQSIKLYVVFKATEALAAIPGMNLALFIPAPVLDGVPERTVIAPQFTGTVTWTLADGATLSDIRFQAKQYYKAAVTLMANPGYIFTDATVFTHSGIKDITGKIVVEERVDALMRFTIYFDETGVYEIDIYELDYYVLPPVVGQGPVRILNLPGMTITANWKIYDGFSWQAMTEKVFRVDCQYRAEITLEAKPGYMFDGEFAYKESDVVTQTGNSSDPSIQAVTVDYKLFDIWPIANYELANYVPLPVVGQGPVTRLDLTEMLVTVSWEQKNGTSWEPMTERAFRVDLQYRAEITLAAKLGYMFDSEFAYKDSEVLTQTGNSSNPSIQAVTATYKEFDLLPVTDYELVNYVPLPVVGQGPVTRLDLTEMLVTVEWKQKNGTSWQPMTEWAFRVDHQYRAVITLAAKLGYMFDSEFAYEDSEVLTQTGESSNPSSQTVTVTYKPFDIWPVTDYELASYVPLPEVGQPQITRQDLTEMLVTVKWKQTNNGTSWSSLPVSMAFKEDGWYQAEMTLRAKPGYRFETGRVFAYTANAADVTEQHQGSQYDPSSRTVTVTYKPFMPRETASGWDSVMDIIMKNKDRPGVFITYTGTSTVTSSPSPLMAGVTSPSKVVINSAGGTVTLSSSGTLLEVGSGITVTLNNITLNGYTSNSYSLIRIAAGGTLALTDVNVKGNNGGTGAPAGIEVAGRLTMDKGEISGHRGTNVVSIASTGWFELNGGKIIGNGTTEGALSTVVTVGAGGRFIMKAAEISGNTLGRSDTIGAVYSLGFFQMDGGSIDNPTGGNRFQVIFAGGDFVMGGAAYIYGEDTEGTVLLSGRKPVYISDSLTTTQAVAINLFHKSSIDEDSFRLGQALITGDLSSANRAKIYFGGNSDRIGSDGKLK